jgi:glutamine phosphoribosylpyrophosphate amidotransferase
MCGIAGFISADPIGKQESYKLCRALLFYARTRGNQSAGVYTGGQLLKKAMDPNSFIELSEFYNLFSDDTTYALLHTRQPTSGSRGDDGAQPFHVEDTVTIHNGYYHDVKKLKTEYAIEKESGVDSELIARYIASHGIVTLPKFLEKTDGPSAIAIMQKNELYFMRSGNPLKTCQFEFDDGNKILLFASTDYILYSALKYVWLISNEIKSTEIPERVLIHATPSGLEVLSKPFDEDHLWANDFDLSAYGQSWESSGPLYSGYKGYGGLNDDLPPYGPYGIDKAQKRYFPDKGKSYSKKYKMHGRQDSTSKR